MKPVVSCLLGTVFSLAPLAAFAAPDLTLNHVVLSSSGLGQYTFTADVDGNARLDFPVRREQVNDVLKSLVILDATGKIGAVTLPGDEGLSTLFRSLPFSQDAFQSLTSFILATRGQTVSVEGASKATGQIMTLTPISHKNADGSESRQHLLSLLTEKGLQQVVLEDVTVLSYQDAKLNDAMKRALQGFAAQTNNDQRQISLSLSGKEKRSIGLSYTIESPVWKVAYRLRLAPAQNAKEDEKGYLQGWAIVENTSAEDWKNVILTLTSGNPVTYQQALYPSYFVQRPFLPLPIPTTAQPRMDRGEIMQQRANYGAAGSGMMMAKREMAVAAPAPARAPLARNDVMFESDATIMQNSQFAGVQTLPTVAEQSTQLAFTFPQPINVKSGDSLMVPFWSASVSGETLYLYQPDTHAEHPYASVAVKNTSASALPSGIVTLYQATTSGQPSQFVGDANLPLIPAGEERLVPFALDQETFIKRDIKQNQTITKVTSVKGVLTLSRMVEKLTEYTVRAPAKKDRLIVIEEPKITDWKLIKPDARDVTETLTHYRIRRNVKAGETQTIETIMQRNEMESIVLAHLAYDGLLYYQNLGAGITDEAKAEIRKAAERRHKVDDLDKQIALKEQQKQSLYGEQERLRKNLKAVPENSDLAKRYLKTLETQENQITDLEQTLEKLRNDRAKAWEEFADKIGELTF